MSNDRDATAFLDPLRPNPYEPEIVGTFVLAPVVLGIETWRRWGELFSPWALDDFSIFAAAIYVALRLRRRDPKAPRLWVFVCGGAWFLMTLSLWGSIYAYDQADPSGAPVGLVIAFKAFGFALVSTAAWRALWLHDPGRPSGH